tara:strand:- start:203 stop:637 length:435 start_codon:yes stop_codon:yes gene_type:complete
MNLSEYIQYAEKDLIIDETELDHESLKTPQLHAKYLDFLVHEKFKLEKVTINFKSYKKRKWMYYTGKLSLEELDELNWEPFELKILKTDLDKFLDADDELQELHLKVKYQQSVVSYLEEIIKIINNRQWNIRSAIDWLKFTNGQ